VELPEPGELSVDLRDTVFVVVGGSVGIGAAIAVALARSGSTVVIAARDTDRLADACRQAAGAGGRAYAERVDVTSPDSIDELVATVESRYGPTRVLVNSAG